MRCALSLLVLACVQAPAAPLEPGGTGTVVFSSDRTGVHQLYLLEVGSHSPRRLVATGREERHPRWSPDGKRIAYESLGAGTRDLFVVGIDGGRPRRVTEDASAASPDWSPDGERLVFVSHREGQPALWTIRVDGEDARRLSPPGARDRWPDWSPDGARIAFSSIVDGDEEIFVMNADGSERRRLTTRAGADARPRWSPDGRELVYAEASARTGGADRLMRIALQGGAGRPLEDRDALRAEYVDRSVATWGGAPHDDGRAVVFTSLRGGNADLYLIERPGESARRLTDDPGMDQEPDWRPDWRPDRAPR